MDILVNQRASKHRDKKIIYPGMLDFIKWTSQLKHVPTLAVHPAVYFSDTFVPYCLEYFESFLRKSMEFGYVNNCPLGSSYDCQNGPNLTDLTDLPLGMCYRIIKFDGFDLYVQ